MDLGTIVGAVVGIIVILIGILLSGVGLLPYFSLASIFVVFFGSYCALLIANPIARMFRVRQYLRHVVHKEISTNADVISVLVHLAERARREGLLALEDNIESIVELFMRRGIQLVIDGTDPEVIKSILYSDLNEMQSRHEVGHRLFDDWSKIAPAFGLIGTLLGLIAMLGNIGGDISAIGRGMQTALITTLYGAIFANLFLLPIRTKLIERDQNETLTKEIIIEGVLAIQSGDNPRIVFEKLLSFLPPSERNVLRHNMNMD